MTFAVPRELWDEYAFLPGQHLTLRATIDGEDVRQSYSICQPRSGRDGMGQLRVASAVVEGGRMSTWLELVGRTRRRDRGDDPDGVVHLPDAADRSAAPCRHRRRFGDHAGAVAHRHGPGGGAVVAGHAAVRQPADQHGDVPRGARGPEEPLPRPVPPRPRAVPRAAGRRPVPRAARPGAVGAHPRRPGPRGQRRRVVPVRPVRDGHRRGVPAQGPRSRPAPHPPRDLPRRRAG